MSAIHMAFVDEVGRTALASEGNCEDAVNVCAYLAYQARNGETPMSEMDVEEMDEFIAASRESVKKNGRFYGIEWEEF